MALIRRVSNELKPAIPFSDPAFAADYPTLHAHLTQTRWDDGSSRLPSTVLLFLEPSGEMKACLNDRANCRSCFITGETVEAILAAIEHALLNDTADWRTKSKMNGAGNNPPF